MPVEGPIVDLSSLNPSWPIDLTDLQSETDDHLRLIKDALQKAFSDMGANGGVVTVTAAEMNHLAGAVDNIQAQLNYVDSRWEHWDGPTLNPVGGEKYLLDPPAAGMTVTLPNAPVAGTEIQFIDASGLAAPPNNTVIINRSGGDTIRDLNTGTDGLITVSLTNAEYRYFVYFPNRWNAWTIPGASGT